MKLFQKLFRKSFWVPYEHSECYPTVEQTMDAIAKYCGESGESYSFLGTDRVLIGQTLYEIKRGYEPGSHGNYGILCTEAEKEGKA